MKNTGKLSIEMINWYDDNHGNQVWHQGDVALSVDVSYVNSLALSMGTIVLKAFYAPA